MPHLSAPSRIVTDGRTWSLAEYARFLSVDAGWWTSDIATETRLTHRQVRSVTRGVVPDYAVGSLCRGEAPFVRYGTTVGPSADERKARRLETGAARMLAHASALRHP